MLRPFSPPPPLPPPPSLTPHRSMASTNICIHLFNSISVCGSVRKKMCREDNMSAAIITKEFHRSFRAFYPVDGAGSLGKDGPAARRTRPDREDDGPPGSSRAEAGGSGRSRGRWAGRYERAGAGGRRLGRWSPADGAGVDRRPAPIVPIFIAGDNCRGYHLLKTFDSCIDSWLWSGIWLSSLWN